LKQLKSHFADFESVHKLTFYTHLHRLALKSLKGMYPTCFLLVLRQSSFNAETTQVRHLDGFSTKINIALLIANNGEPSKNVRRIFRGLKHQNIGKKSKKKID
jgi:hypothetical protein